MAARSNFENRSNKRLRPENPSPETEKTPVKNIKPKYVRYNHHR